MIAMEMMMVGMTRRRPNSSILPSGTFRRPARARDATPGTVKTMPHSSAMAMAVAIRAVPSLPIFGASLRANGAEMTNRTSRKIDCRTVPMARPIV